MTDSLDVSRHSIELTSTSRTGAKPVDLAIADRGKDRLRSTLMASMVGFLLLVAAVAAVTVKQEEGGVTKTHDPTEINSLPSLDKLQSHEPMSASNNGEAAKRRSRNAAKRRVGKASGITPCNKRNCVELCIAMQ